MAPDPKTRQRTTHYEHPRDWLMMLAGVVITCGGWVWALSSKSSEVHSNSQRITKLEAIVESDHDRLVRLQAVFERIETDIHWIRKRLEAGK